MRLNISTSFTRPHTHEGAVVTRISPLQQLRRSVLANMLWEDEFYEDGVASADRIKDLVALVAPSDVAALAIEARHQHHLRHVPLYLTAALAGVARGQSLVAATIDQVIQRADELAEFMAIYAKVNGVHPSRVKSKLSNQVKKGLGAAFVRFGEYELAKYNRKGAVKLRDVLFLAHPKPADEAQRILWKRLIDNDLATPDTWEVALSGGADKKETFERMLREGTLGYLALLRNLRNMVEANVDRGLVKEAILARRGARRVLPFRFVAAARAAPSYEAEIDQALAGVIGEMTPLAGLTVVMVDVSGSMADPLSARSDLTRMDAAATLAAVIPARDLRLFTFSDHLVEVPARRGMAGVAAIIGSQGHQGTRLWEAMSMLQEKIAYDRLIVITDEQVHDGRAVRPTAERAYMINVASSRNGVGYGAWKHIDGFSENVLTWIGAYEASVGQE